MCVATTFTFDSVFLEKECCLKPVRFVRHRLGAAQMIGVEIKDARILVRRGHGSHRRA